MSSTEICSTQAVRTVDNTVRTTRKNILRKISGVITIAVCFVLVSCASKAQTRRNVTDELLGAQDFATLVEYIKSNPRTLYGEASAFLFNMDVGVLYHYMEQFDSSNVYLLRAAEIYDELFMRSVTNEAASLLTNDNVRPYRARPYELVMMHQMIAFNFMAQGRFEEAVVETRKKQILFNEWERTRAASGQFHTDGMSHLFSSLAFEATNEPDNSLISTFHSVRGYKEGPIALTPEIEGFAYDRLVAGGREDDIGILGISAVDDANKWTAEMGETEIIIVSYAGKGPNLRELTWRGEWTNGGRLTIQTPEVDRRGRPHMIDIPAPPLPSDRTAGTTPLRVTLSLPELETFQSETSHFSASLGGGNRFHSVIVNDMDLQAGRAFEEEWAATLMRTVVRVVIRTLAAEETKARTATSNPLANLAIGLATDIGADQMEKADVRMCFMLPRQIHVTRFPVEPGTHTVSLNAYDRYNNVIARHTFDDVSVGRGQKRVLFFRSLR